MNAVISNVSPHEVYTRRDRGEVIHLIDVRTPAEFEEVHADGARLVPLDRFETSDVDTAVGLDPRGVGVTEPLYLVCQSGVRATQAAEKLAQRGYSNVHVVEGGTEGLARVGLPVVRGRASISLERQVQITVGTLVILKVLLGFTISPVFFALAALIGCGLVFAGLTKTCAMANLLARMPWNQRQTCEVAASS